MSDSLSDAFTSEVYLIDKERLCDGGLSPSRFNRGTSDVWILSSSELQTEHFRGIWIDGENWTDTNLWYD